MAKDKDKNKTLEICSSNYTLIGITNFTLQMIPNYDLDSLFGDELQALENYEKCNFKKGVLYLIKKREDDDKYLKLVKVLLEANQQTLKIYRSRQPESLFFQTPISSLEKIGYKYNGTYCFELNLAEIQKTKYKKNVISLCTTGQKELKQWVLSLMELPFCKDNEKSDRKLIQDFSKLNSLESLHKDDFLKYDDRSYKYIPPNITYKEILVGKTVEELRDKIQMSKVEIQRQRRILKEKLEEEKQKTKKVEESTNFSINII